MACAVDLQSVSFPSLVFPPSLNPSCPHDDFDLAMSPSDKETFRDVYFAVAPAPASGRQRTAQACDKCRERKTKCSGEKPVCQRCTTRGLICEYSYREPRLRGPVRTKSSSSKEDSFSKAFPDSKFSLGNSGYVQTQALHRGQYTAPRTTKHHRTISVAPSPFGSHSAYSGAKLRPSHESRSIHSSDWGDARHLPCRSYSSSDLSFAHDWSHRLQMPVPCKVGGMGYDPYLTLQQPSSMLDTRLKSVRDSSILLPEAQETLRYDGSHFSYGFKMPFNCQPPVLSNNDGSRYYTSSKLDSSTPFHPLDPLDDSTSDSHNMAKKYEA